MSDELDDDEWMRTLGIGIGVGLPLLSILLGGLICLIVIYRRRISRKVVNDIENELKLSESEISVAKTSEQSDECIILDNNETVERAKVRENTDIDSCEECFCGRGVSKLDIKSKKIKALMDGPNGIGPEWASNRSTSASDKSTKKMLFRAKKGSESSDRSSFPDNNLTEECSIDNVTSNEMQLSGDNWAVNKDVTQVKEILEALHKRYEWANKKPSCYSSDISKNEESDIKNKLEFQLEKGPCDNIQYNHSERILSSRGSDTLYRNISSDDISTICAEPHNTNNHRLKKQIYQENQNSKINITFNKSQSKSRNAISETPNLYRNYYCKIPADMSETRRSAQFKNTKKRNQSMHKYRKSNYNNYLNQYAIQTNQKFSQEITQPKLTTLRSRNAVAIAEQIIKYNKE